MVEKKINSTRKGDDFLLHLEDKEKKFESINFYLLTFQVHGVQTALRKEEPV